MKDTPKKVKVPKQLWFITDGCYVLTETDIEEGGKVKMFDKFITDLNKLLEL